MDNTSRANLPSQPINLGNKIPRTHGGKILKVKDFDLNKSTQKRGGVILYTLVDGIIYIGLGVDAPTHDLTDFAGSIERRKNESAIEGALREFNEETLKIFQGITRQAVSECLTLFDKNDLVIFIPVDYNPDDISRVFLNQYNKEIEKAKKYNKLPPEVCAITWLSMNDFKSAIYGHSDILYSRTQQFLKKSGNIFDYL